MAKVGTTRYYSDIQEKAIAKLLGGVQSSNSGAGKFVKSDVTVPDASLLIECKTSITDKESFSVKKDWVVKLKEEAFTQRLRYPCIAFNFGPDQKNYFIIDEELMKLLVEKLKEEEL